MLAIYHCYNWIYSKLCARVFYDWCYELGCLPREKCHWIGSVIFLALLFWVLNNRSTYVVRG